MKLTSKLFCSQSFISILALSLIIGCAQNKTALTKNKTNTSKETVTSENLQNTIVLKDTQTSPVELEKEAKEVSSSQTLTQPISMSKKVKEYCQLIDKKFKRYNWGKSHCEKTQWNHVRDSYLGRPLIWKVFGNEQEHKVSKKNMTMILCGVHGDEITPVKFCFDIIDYLKTNPQLIGKDNLVIVAPIVTPDSFFKKRPTRTNARGVDVNRNFPTRDWWAKAQKLWKSRYKKDKRRNPGTRPLSEAEVIFQVNLIKRYGPHKIISVHSPLTLLDYDGPVFKTSSKRTHDKSDPDHIHSGQDLLNQMSQKSNNYKVKNYPFFPGSLGNYAGNERNIPTYTLELPNTDWTKTKKYWLRFKDAITHAIGHQIQPKVVESTK